MTGFVDREQGSTDINWGRSAARAAAGLGVVTGAVLVGTGLDIPVLKDIGEGVADIVTGGGEEAAEAATEAVQTTTENLGTTTPSEVLAKFLESDVKEIVNEIDWTQGPEDLKSAIASKIEALADAHEGNGLFFEDGNHYEDWQKVTQEISSSTPGTVVENIDKLNLSSDFPKESLVDMARTEGYTTLQETVENMPTQYTEVLRSIDVDALMSRLDGVPSDQVAEAAQQHLTQYVDALDKSLLERLGGAVKDNATTLSGLAVGGGSLAYLANNPASAAYQPDPIAEAQAEAAQMNFAQKEQMRSVEALMAARMEAAGQGVAPQGPAVG